MKERIRKLLSIAIMLSLVWGITGSITSVKAYADPVNLCETHTWNYENITASTHSKYCSVCGEEMIDEPHEYDADGHCICGAVDPNVQDDHGHGQQQQPSQFEDPGQPSDPGVDDPPAADDPGPASGQGDNNGQNEGDPAPDPQTETNTKLDGLIHRVDNLINNSDTAEYTNLAINGLTLDMGTWVSFNDETYAKIDELVSKGIPVTIKYVYEGSNCSFTIPAGCEARLASYCNPQTGYIGFEDLANRLMIAGYKISYSKVSHESPVEASAAMISLLNAGDDMLASQGFTQAANAVALEGSEDTAKNLRPGSTTSFTPFAQFGGSSMRAESG